MQGSASEIERRRRIKEIRGNNGHPNGPILKVYRRQKIIEATKYKLFSVDATDLYPLQIPPFA